MPLRYELRSFWWFIDGQCRRYGTVGFNHCHWFDLSFEEGEVLSWMGKQHVALVGAGGPMELSRPAWRQSRHVLRFAA